MSIPTGAVPTREDIAGEIRLIARRLEELSKLCEGRWPELGVHFGLNGAWLNLDRIERVLEGRGQRR